MYMNDKLTEYLYEAYVKLVAYRAEGHTGDLNVGIAMAEAEKGSLTTEEKAIIHHFIRFHTGSGKKDGAVSINGLYKQGYAVFSARVKELVAEDKAADEAAAAKADAE